MILIIIMKNVISIFIEIIKQVEKEINFRKIFVILILNISQIVSCVNNFLKDHIFTIERKIIKIQHHNYILLNIYYSSKRRKITLNKSF